MPFHEVTVTDTVHISGHELGQLFAELDADEMVLFWEGVAGAVAKWRRNEAFQWQSFADALSQSEASYGSTARKPLSGLLEYIT